MSVFNARLMRALSIVAPIRSMGVCMLSTKARASKVAASALLDESPEEEGAGLAVSGDIAKSIPENYKALQSAFRDHIILFQHGNFYNMWGEDAASACRVVPLQMPLSGKAGFPIMTAQHWIPKIVAAGHTVVVVDQILESRPMPASLCDASDIVSALAKSTRATTTTRGISRIITPGTLPHSFRFEDNISSVVLGVFKGGFTDKFALCWVDTITGTVGVGEATAETIRDDIARIEPKEILLPHSCPDVSTFRVRLPGDTFSPPREECNDPKILQAGAALLVEFGLLHVSDVYVTAVPSAWARSETEATKFIKAFYVDSKKEIAAWATGPGRLVLGAAAATLEYLGRTMRADIPKMRLPGQYVARDFLHIDSATRDALELTRAAHGRGHSAGTLLRVLDRTVSKAGRRLLREYLATPLVNVEDIRRRQDLVALLVMDNSLRSGQRMLLKGCADLQQSVQGLTRDGPPDRLISTMISIQDCLGTAISSGEFLEKFLSRAGLKDPQLKSIAKVLQDDRTRALHQLCTSSISNDPVPHVISGRSEALDKAIADKDAAFERIRHLHHKYETEIVMAYPEVFTSPKRLQLVDDPTDGWVFESLRSYEKCFDPSKFIRCKPKSSTSSPHRWTTIELGQVKARLIDANDAVRVEEIKVIKSVAQTLDGHASFLCLVAEALASLDVATTLAEVAVANGYTRPVLVAEPILRVNQGAHAVVENVQSGTQFVRNSCDLDRDRLWVITGPNMGGKSTFLRQHALIVIMAQIGSFVPAKYAVVGIVDRIFTRIGSSDNLAQNQSTFMLEMLETARIVRESTSRSLVLLDEIGRGTSMADGMAIAAAVCHHLAAHVRCRTLFATHFHQLASLAKAVEGVSCHHVLVPEVDGEMVFSHQIQPGTASQSHGIAVARMAGLRGAVVDHAKTIRAELHSALSSIESQVVAAVSKPRTP